MHHVSQSVVYNAHCLVNSIPCEVHVQKPVPHFIIAQIASWNWFPVLHYY